jgi:hypothetical protein
MMLDALEGTARILAGDAEAGTALLKRVKWQAFMRQERVVFRQILVKLEISKLLLPEQDSGDSEADADPEQQPEWRKAVKRFEKQRAGDVLPALPPSRVSGVEPPAGEPLKH